MRKGSLGYGDDGCSLMVFGGLLVMEVGVMEMVVVKVFVVLGRRVIEVAIMEVMVMVMRMEMVLLVVVVVKVVMKVVVEVVMVLVGCVSLDESIKPRGRGREE
ncbi:unnamed protein product [Gadus morhua 'NCC']